MEDVPIIVRRLTDAVGDRLGRPAYCRRVKNRDEWYVTDPIFSFIQHGLKKGVTGYRIGYHIDAEETVGFELVHAPLIARLFKRNLTLSTLTEVVRRTAPYRETHRLYRSSKRAVRAGYDGDRIEAESLLEFVAMLRDFDEQFGFIADLFPRRQNTGKGGGKAPAAGHTFYLHLADRPNEPSSRAGAARLVEASWPLFLCLYPVKPVERRTSSLARSLRTRGIPRACEFASIRMPVGAGISPLCRGEVQGAHIKPHALGGTDRVENGIWLCEYHHQATEGRLSGGREQMNLKVEFVGD